MLAELEAMASATAPKRQPVKSLLAVSPTFKSSEELAAWEHGQGAATEQSPESETPERQATARQTNLAIANQFPPALAERLFVDERAR